MNKTLSVGTGFLIVAALMIALMLHGCGALQMALGSTGAVAAGYGAYRYVGSTPVVETLLNAAGREATIYGLQKLSPETGRVVAADLVLATKDALTYLKTDASTTFADVINQIITAKFQNIDPQVLSEIQLVAGILGEYVPNASVLLNATEIADLTAFIQGMQDGANKYLSHPTVSMKRKYTLERRSLREDTRFPPWFVLVVEKSDCSGCSK